MNNEPISHGNPVNPSKFNTFRVRNVSSFPSSSMTTPISPSDCDINPCVNITLGREYFTSSLKK